MIMYMFAAFALTFMSIMAKAQRIVLEIPQTMLPCADVLRNGINKVTIKSNIGPDFEKYVVLGWSQILGAQILTKGSLVFLEVCKFLIVTANSHCVPYVGNLCSCKYVNTGISTYIMISFILVEQYVEGTFRIKWEHNNRTVIYSNNVTLPSAVNNTSALLELKVEGYTVSGKLGACRINFTSKRQLTFQLCCYITNSCFPKISSSDFVAAGVSSCVKHTMPCSKNQLLNVTKLYSVFNKTDYITCDSCLIGMECATKNGQDNEIKKPIDDKNGQDVEIKKPIDEKSSDTNMLTVLIVTCSVLLLVLLCLLCNLFYLCFKK